MICNLNNINALINYQGLNLLVVSYGGSCSNALVDALQQNNYNCTTKIWNRLLCHCPEYIDCDIPVIYIYDNPIKSFLSMKKRGPGFWDSNQQKLSNNTNVLLSDENLLKLMIKQFNSWTNPKRDNVLVIKSRELFQHSIVNKLENFLGKKMNHFPIKYVNPNTDWIIKDKKLIELFKKYKFEINKINNFIF